MGRYYSYLLPKQARGTPQILVDKTSPMTGRLRVYLELMKFNHQDDVRHIWNETNRTIVHPGVIRDVQDGTVLAEPVAEADGHRLAHPLRAGMSLVARMKKYLVNQIKSSWSYITYTAQIKTRRLYLHLQQIFSLRCFLQSESLF